MKKEDARRLLKYIQPSHQMGKSGYVLIYDGYVDIDFIIECFCAGATKEEFIHMLYGRKRIVARLDEYSNGKNYKALLEYNRIKQIGEKYGIQVFKQTFEEIYVSWIELMKSYGNIVQKRKPEDGQIYLLKTGGYYKIGRSKNFESRYKMYVTENPNKVEVIHKYTSNDYVTEENRLHEMFKDRRHRGERFDLTKEDVLYIKSL